MRDLEQNIKSICKQKGLTMSDVANRIGTSPSNLLSSLKGNPTISKLEDVASALQVSLSELLTMRPDSGQGIVIVGGQTYQLSKPASSTVQIPVFDRYNTLRDEIKDFIKKAIKGGNNISKMGLVESLELFSLTYDRSQDRFILALCYADGKTLTFTYDRYEYCDWNKSKSEKDAPWDLKEIYQDIINDIEGVVPSKLQKL